MRSEASSASMMTVASGAQGSGSGLPAVVGGGELRAHKVHGVDERIDIAAVAEPVGQHAVGGDATARVRLGEHKPKGDGKRTTTTLSKPSGQLHDVGEGWADTGRHDTELQWRAVHCELGSHRCVRSAQRRQVAQLGKETPRKAGKAVCPSPPNDNLTPHLLLNLLEINEQHQPIWPWTEEGLNGAGFAVIVVVDGL
jgi:hypothetical protein